MRRILLVGWIVALGVTGTVAAGASTYGLIRVRAGGGGLPSTTTGAYTLSAAVSQAAAGPLAGGAYRLQAGFLYPLAGAQSSAPGEPPLPTTVALQPARPNPMHDATLLAFELPTPADVRLELFGVDGRRVATLVARHFAAGRHQVNWDGAREDGGRVTPGIYFVSMSTAAHRYTQRLVLLAR